MQYICVCVRACVWCSAKGLLQVCECVGACAVDILCAIVLGDQGLPRLLQDCVVLTYVCNYVFSVEN